MTPQRSRIASLALPLSMAMATVTFGQHADVNPFEHNGRVQTAGIDHDTGTIIKPSHRVFEGEIDLLPDNITPLIVGGDEPGFDTEGAHSNKLPALADLGFNIVTLPTAILAGEENIGYWDGTGPVGFSTVPLPLTLTLRESNDPFTFATASGNSVNVSGFTIDSADGSGDLHTHVDIEFLPGTLNPLDLPAGIYLFSLELTATGLLDSPPIYFVLNYGLDEEFHEEAVDFVVSQVPEPASLGLLAAGGMMLLARRRRLA